MSDNDTTQTQTDIIGEIRTNINDNMTLPAIKQLAKHLGISKYSTMKKQDIIQKITGIIASYRITKQSEIKDICAKSRNIDEDIINYLNQPQTPEQPGTDAAAQLTINMAGLTIQEPQQQPSTTTNIRNRGTGAGGANTNATGLSYEAKTDLSTGYYTETLKIEEKRA